MKLQKRQKSAISVLIALVLSAITLLPLFGGCFSVRLKSMAFKQDELSLNIGEKYTVTASSIHFEPVLATDKSFSLETSDAKTVDIAGDNVIEAVGAGSAVVTAVSNYDPSVTAEINVTVSYPVPSMLSVSASDALLYKDNVHAVEFTVAADRLLDPELSYVWKVDGETVEGESESSFTFTPENKAGEYEIGVWLDEYKLSGSAKLKVFSARVENAEAALTGGSTVQDGEYSAVRLALDYKAAEGDPDPIIEWSVNGSLRQTDSKTFSFTPSQAGIYDITLKVNGDSVNIDGESKLTVTAKGSVTPRDVTVRFDNIYPNVMIQWDYPHTDGTGYQIKVENLTSKTVNETLRTTNISARPFFDGASFNAREVLDLSKYSYRISVRSLGDGEVYTESEYSSPVTVEKLSASAIGYLNDKVLGGSMDHYLTSDDEFCELYAYYMAFRGETKNIEYNAYVAYNTSKSYNDLADVAFDYGATTGTFRHSVTGRNPFRTGMGDIVKVGITVVSNGLMPEKTGAADVRQLNALAPHIAPSQTRTRDHEFAIDKVSASQRVSTSEELFRTAEYGVRPVPVEGSRAYTLYNFARRTLLRIISDDMTDAEKVHAIYDWIMWNVQYDYTASKSDKPGEYKAYYLEGVLTDSDSFAVCDGMAKTLVLMCSMEGIEAVRVTGRAGNSVAGLSAYEAQKVKQNDWGGHAWNKVKVDGEWYVVDPTWGDTVCRVGSSQYEAALHSWLLVSDSDIYDTHEYDNYIRNPATAEKSYGIYEKMSFEYVAGGKTMTTDAYIDVFGTAMTSEIEGMMQYLDYERKNSSRAITIGNKTLTRSYIGFEISSSAAARDSLLEAARRMSNNPFVLALTKLGYARSSYSILTNSNSVIVLLQM